MGNREGPHALACEWVGTQLAVWFGLRTFDLAIMNVTADDEIPLGHGRSAEPGPAIASRREKGAPWSGDPSDLKRIDNPADIAGLVVFDTWVLNPDRHPPDANARRPNYDNVFLSEEGAEAGRFILKVIDHTHCFGFTGEITRRMAGVDRVRDTRIYGLFPGFVPFINREGVRTWAERLRRVDVALVERVVRTIPPEWEVSTLARRALVELVCGRATFVADTIMNALTRSCFPQGEFDFNQEEDRP
jgi:hypothetical protein